MTFFMYTFVVAIASFYQATWQAVHTEPVLAFLCYALSAVSMTLSLYFLYQDKAQLYTLFKNATYQHDL